MEKKRSLKTHQKVESLDTCDLRAVTGGVRMWRPVGYTDTGEPIYEEYDDGTGIGVEPDYGRLRVPGG